MKKLIVVLVIVLFSCKNSRSNKSVTSEKEIEKIDEVYSYSSSCKEMSQSYELSLNSNNNFKYIHVNDEGCYRWTVVSYGKWKQKGNEIKLIVADSLKPIVHFKKEFLKKDTITILDESATGNLVLHSKDKKEIEYIDGKPKEFSVDKGVSKIELFISTKYLEVEIPENTGQIIIENLLGSVVTDFSSYKFIKRKGRINLTNHFVNVDLVKE